MGKFILCAGPLAKEPYHFALTNTDVYSLEELGYYLYHNIYTISLKTFDEHFFRWIHFHSLEEEMATHSSVLAWRIPGTGSLVGCRLWGRRVGYD